jgi:hypothetical protein
MEYVQIQNLTLGSFVKSVEDYQRKKVVGLERSPPSLVSTSEELLDRKVVALV